MTPQQLFKTITIIQNLLLATSILMLMILPVYITFHEGGISGEARGALYGISHIAVTLVMVIRPLANLFPKKRTLAQLTILRKGFGVFSAAIIVSFILSDIIITGTDYMSRFLTTQYWSLDRYTLLAHIGDITAVVLLVTSNNYSKRILGKWWKRVQKLAYIYFYAGASYAYLALDDTMTLIAIVVVTTVTVLAYIKNHYTAKN